MFPEVSFSFHSPFIVKKSKGIAKRGINVRFGSVGESPVGDMA